MKIIPGTILGLLVAVILAAQVRFPAPGNRSDAAAVNTNTKKASKQLTIRAELSKSAFALNDGGQILIRLRNEGKSAISILNSGGRAGKAGISFYITAKDGTPVRSKIISDAQVPPPYAADDFIELSGDEYSEIEAWLGIEAGGIRSPGEYRLIVAYRSQVPRKLAPKDLKIWSLEDGEIRSNEIVFTVK